MWATLKWPRSGSCPDSSITYAALSSTPPSRGYRIRYWCASRTSRPRCRDGKPTRILPEITLTPTTFPLNSESARRNHPMACECDIIETCHMRLSLLQMAFGKHIERKHCCFFAGSILDEVLNVLQHIRVTKVLGRPYKVTDELFDQSTMAMEYFKEHIEPGLPDLVYFSKSFLNFTCALAHHSRSSQANRIDCPLSFQPTRTRTLWTPHRRRPGRARKLTHRRSRHRRTWYCGRASGRSSRA